MVMRNRRRPVLVVAIVGALLSVMSATAAALRSLEINEPGLQIRYRALSFTTEATRIICPATFEIVLEARRIPKTAGARIGNLVLYKVEEGNCTESGMSAGFIRTVEERVSREIRYEGFAGTLPRISSFKITIATIKFLIMSGLLRCLMEGTAAGIFHVNEAGVVEPLEADSSRAITMGTPLMLGLCPERVTRSGLAVVLRREDLMGGATLRLL
jgi:hypothetical protein